MMISALSAPMAFISSSPNERQRSTDMQMLLEKSDGTRVPVKLGNYGIDKIRLDQLMKAGKVYHVIKTDKVEIIKMSVGA
jgi:hypothetical protein